MKQIYFGENNILYTVFFMLIIIVYGCTQKYTVNINDRNIQYINEKIIYHRIDFIKVNDRAMSSTTEYYEKQLKPLLVESGNGVDAEAAIKKYNETMSAIDGKLSKDAEYIHGTPEIKLAMKLDAILEELDEKNVDQETCCEMWKNSLWEMPVRFKDGLPRSNAKLSKYALLNDEDIDALKDIERLIAETKRKCPKTAFRIQVRGYASVQRSAYTPNQNMDLGKNRSEAIVKYLLDQNPELKEEDFYIAPSMISKDKDTQQDNQYVIFEPQFDDCDR